MIVNVPETPAPTLGFVQELTGNPVQVHPAGGVTDTNVRFAAGASVSVNVPPVIAVVPVLVTTCV
jgi:hypothetical protein